MVLCTASGFTSAGAGRPTIPEVADDYWAVGHHPDLDADPTAKKEHGGLMKRLLAKVRR